MVSVMVYPFEALNYRPGEGPRSRRMGTSEAISRIHGAKPIMDSGVEIDESQLDPDLPGMTPVDFKP